MHRPMGVNGIEDIASHLNLKILNLKIRRLL